ncbi:hypothetical protein QAD02_003270 [Eretmocerus hayati]|uniref:Uncharacterized protein n=1 Tax=Eretmocerus hayati TaxID=131215 RepID=A0ACC2NN18_9HYME|nr:hypothetical protein QAD02_003270 [Eretmocerus hayati]
MNNLNSKYCKCDGSLDKKMEHEERIAVYMRVMLLSLHILGLLAIQFRSIRIRRWWVRPHLKEHIRQQFGALSTIFIYFYLNDQEQFYHFVGMTTEHFSILLNLVRHQLTKHSFRTPLLPELKLAAVLHILVHNVDPKTVALFYRIGESTIYAIIPEVCQAIVDNLMDVYIRLPATTEDWMDVANAFYQKYQMPLCMGVLDVKEVRIRQPPHSGALFFNHKGFYSVGLMAVCDSNMMSLWISVGDFGGANDSSKFARSSLGIALRDNLIEIFTLAIQVPNTHISLTPFIIADGGFGLQRYVLEPYPLDIHSPIEHSIFDIRLGAPRKLIEQGFGITQTFDRSCIEQMKV